MPDEFDDEFDDALDDDFFDDEDDQDREDEEFLGFLAGDFAAGGDLFFDFFFGF
jgi:hypothetical protein